MLELDRIPHTELRRCFRLADDLYLSLDVRTNLGTWSDGFSDLVLARSWFYMRLGLEDKYVCMVCEYPNPARIIKWQFNLEGRFHCSRAEGLNSDL